MYNSTGYLICQKLGITYIISHNHARIKTDSDDSLPLGKTLTLVNVKIPNKSVFNEDKNHYYSNRFFEKCPYK